MSHLGLRTIGRVGGNLWLGYAKAPGRVRLHGAPWPLGYTILRRPWRR